MSALPRQPASERDRLVSASARRAKAGCVDWNTGEITARRPFPDDSRKWNAYGGLPRCVHDQTGECSRHEVVRMKGSCPLLRIASVGDVRQCVRSRRRSRHAEGLVTPARLSLGLRAGAGDLRFRLFRLRPAATIGIFLAVDRRYVRRISIEIRAPDPILRAVLIDPFPQGFA